MICEIVRVGLQTSPYLYLPKLPSHLVTLGQQLPLDLLQTLLSFPLELVASQKVVRVETKNYNDVIYGYVLPCQVIVTASASVTLFSQVDKILLRIFYL